MKKLLAMTALTLAFASPAMAEDMDHHDGAHHQKGGMMFEKLDLNNNGEITREEFVAFHETKFTEIDKDASGVITPDEAEAAKAEWKEKMKERRAEHKKMKDDVAE